jgi:hypothetical protein
MNISYPTVKKLLDDVIVGLGYDATDDEDAPQKEAPATSKQKSEVLEKLGKGEISVEDALKLIKKGE